MGILEAIIFSVIMFLFYTNAKFCLIAFVIALVGILIYRQKEKGA